MTPANQARLSVLYATPYDELTPKQRLQRISLHELWLRELDDLIDRLNRSRPIVNQRGVQ
jgi:hypothetical protein